MLDDKIIEQFKVKSFQSVRHLIHNGVLYAIFITNRFRKMGWMTEIGGKHYGNVVKLSLVEKDDIIDVYVSLDTNAKQTINEVCKQLS